MPLEVARLVVKVGGDTRDAQAKLGALDKSLKDHQRSFGQGAAALGKKLSMSLTLPIVGIGTAAVKSSMDFSLSMSRIEGLVGDSREAVGAWSKELLKLAPQLGRGPNELAKALYFVRSSGVEAGKSMDVVVQSAKASVAGLGDVAQIADLATSAMSAYKSENLSAANALDIVTAAVREGKAEADSFAGAIGAVIPVGSQLKVGFDEISAAMAAMTLTGANAEEAATRVRGILMQTLTTTSQGALALESVGMSYESLRQKMGVDFLGTLVDLNKAFEGNQERLREVFNENRALLGVMQLVGGDTEKTRQIFEATANSAGDMGRAFDIGAATPAEKMRQAFASVQAAGVELGGVLTPVVLDLTGRISGMAHAFTELPPGVQQAAASIAGALAVAGPAMMAVGYATQAINMLRTSAAARIAVEIVIIGATIEAIKNVSGLSDALKDLKKSIDGLASATTTMVDKSWKKLGDMKLPVQLFADIDALKLKIGSLPKATADNIDEILKHYRTFEAGHKNLTAGVKAELDRQILYWQSYGETLKQQEGVNRGTLDFMKQGLQLWGLTITRFMAGIDLNKPLADNLKLMERNWGMTWGKMDAKARQELADILDTTVAELDAIAREMASGGRTIGAALMYGMASGIASGYGAVYAALNAVAPKIKAHAEAVLHASPELFTKKLGLQLMKELGEGMLAGLPELKAYIAAIGAEVTKATEESLIERMRPVVRGKRLVEAAGGFAGLDLSKLGIQQLADVTAFARSLRELPEAVEAAKSAIAALAPAVADAFKGKLPPTQKDLEDKLVQYRAWLAQLRETTEQTLRKPSAGTEIWMSPAEEMRRAETAIMGAISPLLAGPLRRGEGTVALDLMGQLRADTERWMVVTNALHESWEGVHNAIAETVDLVAEQAADAFDAAVERWGEDTKRIRDFIGEFKSGISEAFGSLFPQVLSKAELEHMNFWQRIQVSVTEALDRIAQKLLTSWVFEALSGLLLPQVAPAFPMPPALAPVLAPAGPSLSPGGASAGEGAGSFGISSRSMPPVTVNIYARDVESFRRSRGQVAQEIAGAVATARRFS